MSSATFGGYELLPDRVPLSFRPALIQDARIHEFAATAGKDFLQGGYRLSITGTLHGEHVTIELDREDVMEGIAQDWTVEELALIRRRLDRFARREI